MTQYKETIINVLTGETTVRPYTEDEIAKAKNELAAAQIDMEELATKEIARQAVLTKLGLTADEAKLLLG